MVEITRKDLFEWGVATGIVSMASHQGAHSSEQRCSAYIYLMIEGSGRGKVSTGSVALREGDLVDFFRFERRPSWPRVRTTYFQCHKAISRPVEYFFSGRGESLLLENGAQRITTREMARLMHNTIGSHEINPPVVVRFMTAVRQVGTHTIKMPRAVFGHLFGNFAHPQLTLFSLGAMFGGVSGFLLHLPPAADTERSGEGWIFDAITGALAGGFAGALFSDLYIKEKLAAAYGASIVVGFATLFLINVATRWFKEPPLSLQGDPSHI